MDLAFPLALDSAGRLDTVDLVEESQQRCYVVLSSQQGEWALDTSYGVPWRQILGSRPVRLGEARAAILQQLLAAPGVDRVVSLDLVEESDRTLTVTGQIEASGVTVEIGS